ncbi:NifU N-terminal domain-containing protein, partial [Candidatus Azambacteria bacterium]|nr:NifU N-terminal domain-containing protein [Candidatus Azambacteria bacterium]
KTEGETKATRAKEAIAKILGLQGIQDVSIDRYKVAVERSKAVPWEEIIPKVEAILREVYETPASVEVAPVVGLSQGDGL